MATDWKHDDLLNDLANHLAINQDRMLWTDLQLGPVGSVRPDVYAVRRSYTEPEATAYEIKVSASDLRSDLTTGKWRKYLDYAGSVVFAVPQDLSKEARASVPREAGVMVRSDRGWRMARKPVGGTTRIPWQAMQKLLIDGMHREYRNIRAARGLLHRRFTEQETRQRVLGDELAQLVADRSVAKSRMENEIKAFRVRCDVAREDHNKAMAALHEEVRQIAEALGLGEHANASMCASALRRMRAAAVPVEARRTVLRGVSTMKRALRELEDSLDA